ncbi:aminoglycoside 6-adenylyltransferase [Candidatus Roizmanbacteria bacterium]|nr:aminoglycoside 6-adenylyltransferase [Candidatus Roizmanbacteria bacterium]
MDEILKKVVSWAESQESIRSLILTSSRAGASKTDEFSDYDVMVLTDNAEPYLISDEWLKTIDNVWVYQKEQFMHDESVIPTRLTIFQGGTKVDFSFWKTEILKNFIKNGFSETDDLNRGYQVLLDKDGLTKDLPKPSIKFFQIPKPDKDEFLTTVHDFWFEFLGVAKYLKRGDLFFAKKINNGIVKDLFLRMIIWNVQAKNNWAKETPLHTDGKKLQLWAGNEMFEQLGKTYSGFNLEDSWKSLFASIDFFRKLSTETCQLLGYKYPEEVDKNISGYIEAMYRK